MELREPHERAGFAGWWPLFWPPSAPLRERYVVRLTVVGADSISARPGRRGRRPLRINFMFAIKGKGPRRGQAPPYSTILYGAFRPRRGQSGEERKSVKKNAALLCFLAFLLLDHNFGVLRGEQPLSRAPRLGSSGTFLLLFWSQKSRHSGRRPL